MKKYIIFYLLLIFSLTSVKSQVKDIIQLEKSQVMDFSARELQKYIYLRTDKYLPIIFNKDKIGSTNHIILKKDNILEKEEYSIEKIRENLYIKGGSEVAVLYGVYSFAEYMGVRFALHGDIIPDQKFNGSLFKCNLKNIKPLFSKRGLLPFHDFPEGPDLWDEDNYKACISQMIKMKLNFFSLHNYPNVEPNVWIGLSEDVSDDGKVQYAYPTTLAHTILNNNWGYASMNTKKYSGGAADLFGDSVYMSPLLKGASPWPSNQTQMKNTFNRTGEMFNRVFSFGKRFDIQFCLGLESPLSIPNQVKDRLKEKGVDPNSKKAVFNLYKGVFSRIKKAHPIDYFWLWTPENWTWGTPSQTSINKTIEDVKIARKALQETIPSCGFGLSGWVIGPPNDKCLFDRVLSNKNDFMGSLSRLCGQERVDLGYHQLPKDRFSFPILWMEDDPSITQPQFWVGRLRSDLAECYGIGCKGVNANFWRTSSIAPNLMAYAQACWKQKEWNPFWGKEFKTELVKGDLRRGGIGQNFGKHIKGTEDQYMYNNQRYDLKGYDINIPNGDYKITFMFSETKYKKQGQRIFSIDVEGKEVFSKIDVCKAVGYDTIYHITTPIIHVDDYVLNIDMKPIKGETFLSAFVIEGKTSDANQVKGTPYKRCIDVGGGLWKEFEADLNEVESNLPTMNRDMEQYSFYLDYARSMFGNNIAPKIAHIFTSLDGNKGNEGFRNFKIPRPTAWIGGPGAINQNELNWEQEASKYAFVDSMLLIRKDVKGKGNLERFDYWLNTFFYFKSIGHLGCIRGEIDKQVNSLKYKSSSEQKVFIKEKILPNRILLSREWENMMKYLIQTVYTTGELGTVMNLESHTRKALGFLTKYDNLLEKIIEEKLPNEINLSMNYKSEPRMFVLNERSVLQRYEPYSLRVNILGSEKMTKNPVLYYRKLGLKQFQRINMRKKSNNVFEINVPINNDNVVEYYIEAEFSNKKICYPVTSPKLNRTWTFF